MQLVKGKITFAAETPPFTGATIYVRLENVTEADIAAKVVADYVQRDVAFDPKAGGDLSFSLASDPPDPRASYTVRVHIDIDGVGEVSKGDQQKSNGRFMDAPEIQEKDFALVTRTVQNNNTQSGP